jgi:hypothetical protein
MIFCCNTYHLLDERIKYFTRLQKKLKPGGATCSFFFIDDYTERQRWTYYYYYYHHHCYYYYYYYYECMVFSRGSPLTSLSLSKSAWLLFWHRSPTTVCGRTPKSGIYLIRHFYVFTSKDGSHTILSSAHLLIKVVRRTMFGVTPYWQKTWVWEEKSERKPSGLETDSPRYLKNTVENVSKKPVESVSKIRTNSCCEWFVVVCVVCVCGVLCVCVCVCVCMLCV